MATLPSMDFMENREKGCQFYFTVKPLSQTRSTFK